MGPKPPIGTSVSADVKDTVTAPPPEYYRYIDVTINISYEYIQNIASLEGLSVR